MQSVLLFHQSFQNLSLPHSMLNYTFTRKKITNRFVCIKINRSISWRKYESVHLTQAKPCSELRCIHRDFKMNNPIRLEEGWVGKRVTSCLKAFLPEPNKPKFWQAQGMPRAASLGSSICTPMWVNRRSQRCSLVFLARRQSLSHCSQALFNLWLVNHMPQQVINMPRLCSCPLALHASRLL